MLITSPPVTAASFDPEWLAGRSVIYLDLHGDAGSPWLYSKAGDALHVDQIYDAKVNGALVYATTCYLPETPFLDAFREAGAWGVIGGAGQNWGGRRWPIGAQWLAVRLLTQMQAGRTVEDALEGAKFLLRNAKWQNWRHKIPTQDALEFKLWRYDG